MKWTESDTRANLIDPALEKSGWTMKNIYREHNYTDGRKLVGNKRGKQKKVDYLLHYYNTYIGIIEAKRYDKQPTEGLQQAIDYAQDLKVRFVYWKNRRN